MGHLLPQCPLLKLSASSAPAEKVPSGSYVQSNYHRWDGRIGKDSSLRGDGKEQQYQGVQDATLTQGDDRRRAGYDSLGEMVARLLGRHEDCVMDESHLTVPDFRDTFRNFAMSFLERRRAGVDSFEHNIVACINNVFHDSQVNGRIGLGRLEALENQRKVYAVPLPVTSQDTDSHDWYTGKNPQSSTIVRRRRGVKWLHDEIIRLTPVCSGR